MRSKALLRFCAFLCVQLLFGGRHVAARSAPATTEVHKLVQAPTLQAPRRGTLAGSLSASSIAATDVTRGAFSLPFPVGLPTERGKPLAEILPRYRPDQGQTEWGLGWASQLSLERTALRGEVAYDDTDLLQSPWGPLTHGTDGGYHPVGLTQAIRLVKAGPGWEARDQEGNRYVFAEQSGLRGPHGASSWHLVEAKSLNGATSRFVYSVKLGTAYLDQVTYGGPGGRREVQLVFERAPVPKPLLRYVAGRATWLGQRVTGIAICMRQPDGRWAKQRSIGLTHEFDPHGPAFVLRSVQVMYPDGAQEPAVTYSHADWREHLAAASVEANPALQTYLDIQGLPQAGVITQDWSTLADLDDDGQMDIERAYDFQAFRGTAKGFVPMTPVTVAQQPDPDCWQPPGRFNLTRPLARLHPEDKEVRVVDVQAARAQSRVKVCDRGGKLLSQQLLRGDWELGPLVRLADLDRDLRPDLVRMQPGSVSVRRNKSTGGSYVFGDEVEQPLQPRLEPDAFWVHDMNGDGVADLVAATPDGIWVWYGKGQATFEVRAQEFSFRSNGLPHLPTSDDEIYFIDANHDGLTDVLLLEDRRYPELFINTGSTFEFVDVPALATIPAEANQYVVADLSGSGNTELAFTIWDEAKRVALDAPDTGLLQDVNDGRGNSWAFEYGRAAPVEGGGARPAVLTQVNVATAGQPPLTRKFGYDGPTRHSVGRYLLGYERVEVSNGRTFEEATYTFLNDTPPQPARQLRADIDRKANPVGAVAETDYVPDTFHGVPYLRRVQERSGSEDAASHNLITSTTRFSHYANPWCPLRVITATDDGTLTHERDLAAPRELAGVAHCLEAEERWQGSHADPSLDFAIGTRRERNDAGQITAVFQSPKILLQTVEYDATGRIARLAAPGQGQTTLAYGADGRLSSVVGADGVTLAAEYDPLFDQVRALRTTRGSRGWNQTFTYDSVGRLSAAWDDLTGTTEQNPKESYAYTWATKTSPARVEKRSLVDDGKWRRSVEILDGGDSLLAQAVVSPTGWHVSDVSYVDEGSGHRSSWRPHAGLTALAPDLWTFAALYDGATRRSLVEQDGLGRARKASSALTESVLQVEETSAEISGYLWASSSVAGRPPTKVGYNSAGHQALVRDQAGHQTGYVYDALGRLRRMTFADGSTHLVDYDARGRLVKSQRRGLACLEYVYHADKNLLRETIHGDGDCKPVRRTLFAYDALGRLTRETQIGESAGKRDIQFYYDGQRPDGSVLPGQTGFLSAVAADDYKKLFLYDADGALIEQEINFANWRTLKERKTLHRDRSTAGLSRKLLDPVGQVVADASYRYHIDDFGRLAYAAQGNALIYRVVYDDRGRGKGLQFGNGEEVEVTFDPLTDAIVQVHHAGASHTWDQQIQFDARGDIVRTDLWQDSKRFSKTFGYDDRDFLSTVDGRPTYAYDAVGKLLLPASASVPARDKLGRAIKAHGWELGYGLDGTLTSLTAPGTAQPAWQFVSDEGQRRIVEHRDGKPVYGRHEGLLITADAVVEPLRLGSYTVGFVANGTPSLLPADAVGTVLLDGSGNLSPPEPFGLRAGQALHGEAMDFGRGHRTGTSSLIRMGSRDYDPNVGSFTTPDATILREPALCVKYPEQCNLFSYAKNSPLRFNDPTGSLVPALVAGAAAVAEGAAAGAVAVESATLVSVSATELALALGAYFAAQIQRWEAPPDLQTIDPMRYGWYLHMAEQGVYAGYISPVVASSGPSTSNQISVQPQWPPYDGFEAGKSYWMHLLPCTLIDRYGYETGSFFAHVGTPFDQRALPAKNQSFDLWQYEVMKPLLVQGGYAAAWFGQPGGGAQYKSELSAQDLVNLNFLRRIGNANP